MARRPAPPNPTRRLALASESTWNDPREADEDESLDDTGTRPPLDEEDLGGGRERTMPGDGKKRVPVTVNLTTTELDALADEFSAELSNQYSAQANLRKEIEQWLTLYRAKPLWARKNYPLEGASNVTVALAAIYTDQVDARLMQAIFQPEPMWLVRQLNRKFADACKPYERYLDWTREHMWNQREVVFDFIQDLTRLGTGIIYNDFSRESIRRYDDVRNATVEEQIRTGPRPRWIAREDFLVPVGYSSLQLAPYCAHRNWFSWDALERMAFDNRIQDLDNLWGHSDDEDQIKVIRRKDKNLQLNTADDDRFGLWAPWTIWFRRDLDRDGYPEEYVMMLHTETKTVLRLVANPSPSGTRPYVHGRFIKVNGEFDGIGIPEQVEQLQEEASTIHNQRRDRSHLANIVMYKKKITAQSVPETIRPESGKVFTVQDMNDLQEFNVSNPVQMEAFEEDFVRRLASERVGMSDIDMSRMSSPMGRAAATTVMALMQEGARRFDLNVSLVRAALTEQAHQITELWQMYSLPAPEEIGSPEQVLDDKDAEIVRALLSNQQSLRGYIAIQLNAATAAVNREVEKQSNMQLFGLIQGYMNSVAGQIAPVILNPQAPPPLKQLLLHGVQGMDKIMEKIFQSHNQFDLETVLAGELLEQMASAVQQNPQMGMQEAPPEGQQRMPQEGAAAPAPPGPPQQRRRLPGPPQ